MRISDWSSDVCSSDLAEHVAQRVRGAAQHADLLAVGDDLLRRVRVDGDKLDVRNLFEKPLGQQDLRALVALAHSVLGRGTQSTRPRVDRVHVGGALEVYLDALPQVVDG